MPVLIGIALKSLLIAGLTLGLLELMRRRSAAERSWVAHIGLFALVLLALAPLVLPDWKVEAPGLLGNVPKVEATAAPAPAAPVAAPVTEVKAVKPIAPAAEPIIAQAAAAQPSISATAATIALYAVPAAILLFITLLALGRLIALRARADVLVDGHWLSALARAQRRMGFKHGTALLTSDELASPVSWGLMRPVIVLNTRAVEAAHEAEAIIAHELAHVARMDWIKLLLARLATALFWFNPFVWALAREAHQLREEAADDAVLAADIADTDYAQLLVGVARHDCPGLLLGAHGVAPSRNSLARRIARVLDVKSVRGPAAKSFAAGVLAGAVMVAAPLAALTLIPGGTKQAEKNAKLAAPAKASAAASSYYPEKADVPNDLPHLIADGVTTAVTVVAPPKPDAQQARAQAIAEAVASATKARETALATAAQARINARMALAEANDGRERANDALSDAQVDRIVQMKAVGLTPDYVNAMRAVSPTLRSLDPSEMVSLKSVGVTPEYAQAMAAAGFRNLDEKDLTQAKAIGLSPDYVRAMVGAGLRPDIDDFVQLRAVGVPVQYVTAIRKSGHRVNADQIVQMWAVGVKPGDFNFSFDFKGPAAPRAPQPPKPPSTRGHKGLPAASPPDWDPPDSDPDG
jgi:beta-lactamase regulating signal transducer with metallopeptidase domain